MRRDIDLEWIALSLQAGTRALAGQVAILDAHVELLVDRLADEQAARVVLERAAASTAAVGTEDCSHPDEYRLEAGSMRSPLRFFCKACRRFVDPARPDPASPSRSPVDVESR